MDALGLIERRDDDRKSSRPDLGLVLRSLSHRLHLIHRHLSIKGISEYSATIYDGRQLLYLIDYKIVFRSLATNFIGNRQSPSQSASR